MGCAHATACTLAICSSSSSHAVPFVTSRNAKANINTILSYPFEKFLGGHVARWGDRTDVLEYQQFFDDLLQLAAESVLSAADQFLPLYEDGNIFLFLRTWYDSMAFVPASWLKNGVGNWLPSMSTILEGTLDMTPERGVRQGSLT